MSRIELLKKVSRKAGDCLSEYFGTELEIRMKGELDLVTQADEAAESLIVSAITTHYPDDEILAEEGGGKTGSSGWKWIIDPLDGTTNFAHGLPHFAVSAALAKDGVLEAGIINDPMKNQLFAATRGKGATLNGVPIRVGSRTRLSESLSATGFSYDRRERMPVLLERVSNLLNHCQGMRRFGSAALDLAYVACGRFDLFIEDGLNAWDVAAGVLLVEEAGGFTCDFSASGTDLDKGQIVACNQALKDQVIAHLL